MSNDKHVARARRLKAYNLFLQGYSYADIARECQVTKSMVGRWANLEQWKHRLAGVEQQTKDLIEATVSDEIARAVAFMRRCIPDRMKELDAACRRGSVTAILAWLNRSGVPVKGEEADAKPSAIEMRDDITPSKPIEQAH